MVVADQVYSEPANDDIDGSSEELGQQEPEQHELDLVLIHLRAYQKACNIPLLPEEEEMAVLKWIVKGGRLPPDLSLDEQWRKLNPPVTVDPQAAFRHNNWAQVHLLLAMAEVHGAIPPLQDILAIAETYAMAVLDRVRVDPVDAKSIVVEVSRNARLILDRHNPNPQIQ